MTTAGSTPAGTRLYRGGPVLSPGAAPAGTAVATIADRIVAVGPEADCRAALPTGHEVVDLAGRTLAPGFVDAHVQPLIMCVFEQQLILDGCRSITEVTDLVADRARATVDRPDEAIVGFQLDGALLADGRLPTAAELDRASGGRRVVLVRRDGHNAVGSTAAIAAAGLASPGSDPPGGRVDRDAQGRPTGVVRENAVAPLLGLLPEVTMESLEAGLAGWSARLLRQGVTGISRTYPYRSLLDAGVTVAGSSDAPIERTDVLEAMAAAVDRGGPDGLAPGQAISAAEALGLYTTGAARARRTEADQGALRPGHRADLVVLSADPTVPGALGGDGARPAVLATVIGGVEHHRHPDLTVQPAP